MMHRFENCKKKHYREIEPVNLNTVNHRPQQNDFLHFSFIDYSKKIYENYFYKLAYPWGHLNHYFFFH